jgi:hypothetical protein
MVNLPDKTQLKTAATKDRRDYLEDLRARVDGLVSAGGNVSYKDALDAVQAAARFAGQIGSIEAL